MFTARALAVQFSYVEVSVAADIAALWDYAKIAESARRFREALKTETGDAARWRSKRRSRAPSACGAILCVPIRRWMPSPANLGQHCAARAYPLPAGRGRTLSRVRFEGEAAVFRMPFETQREDGTFSIRGAYLASQKNLDDRWRWNRWRCASRSQPAKLPRDPLARVDPPTTWARLGRIAAI